MKNKCKFVGIMFLCILIVCTLAVMAYEHTAGMKGAAGGASNASGNTKNTDEADDMLTVVTSFYPMYIATLNIVDGVNGVRLENLSEPQTGCLHDFQLTPEDMKLLSTADVFVINGGGIESFMSDVAKAYPKLDVVEACEDVALLSEDDADSDHDHDHEEHEHHHDHDEECSCGCGHDHDHHHHHHADDVFTSWGKETVHKYTEEELDYLLKALSETTSYGTILRSKGIIQMTDGSWKQFDLVPEEYEVREGQPDYTGRICVIGTDLKEDDLLKLFHV